ncbi:MAG: V-type ATP synthase subunit D [Spirochaetes bacterium]|nr:V-type ATP synthase subunit D [Spirochaetota bacterium]
MARYEVPPTKTNLLRLKQELVLAQEGFELLDQKRNILIVELMGIIDRAKRLETELDDYLKKAFQSLQMAVRNHGRKNLNLLAGTIKIEHNISISQRKVMGVPLAIVNVTYKENPPYFSFVDTNFWVDEAIFNFKETLKIIGELAQTRISLIRLAREVSRTIRKVNALEKIAIPDYKETVQYIQQRLDEAEREQFYLMKMIKKRLEQKNISDSRLQTGCL